MGDQTACQSPWEARPGIDGDAEDESGAEVKAEAESAAEEDVDASAEAPSGDLLSESCVASEGSRSCSEVSCIASDSSWRDECPVESAGEAVSGTGEGEGDMIRVEVEVEGQDRFKLRITELGIVCRRGFVLKSDAAYATPSITHPPPFPST